MVSVCVRVCMSVHECVKVCVHVCTCVYACMCIYITITPLSCPSSPSRPQGGRVCLTVQHPRRGGCSCCQGPSGGSAGPHAGGHPGAWEQHVDSRHSLETHTIYTYILWNSTITVLRLWYSIIIVCLAA